MKQKILILNIVFIFMFGCMDDIDNTQIIETPSGQNFQLDNVDNITFTSDSGLLISGPYNGNYTLIKTDKELNIEWTKNNYEWGDLVYGSWGSSSQYCQIIKIFQLCNGQYLCFLSKMEGTDILLSSVLIVLLGQNGDQLQEYRFDYFYVSNVLRTNDEGYILFGGGNPTTIKLDKNFSLQWTKDFLDNLYSPIQIVSTSNGGFAITGTYNASKQVYLKTYDSNGNELMSKTYKHNNNPSLEGGNDIIQLADNGFLIVGRAGRTLPQITDCQIIRTNDIGDTIWTRRFIYSNYSWFDRIIFSELNKFILEGTIGHPNEHQKSILMKINENGQVLDSLSESKFQMIVHSPLDFYIKAIKIDPTHINLSKFNVDNLFNKE